MYSFLILELEFIYTAIDGLYIRCIALCIQ